MTDSGPKWTPERISGWKPIAQFVISYGAAVFLIVYGTLNAVELGITLVASMFTLAAGCLGVPHMLRIDQAGKPGGKDEE